MNARYNAVSPFSTGGGGFRFELQVAVSYLISLLRCEVARGMPDGVVTEIRLQQRNRDCPVDDIVINCQSATKKSTLYIQVKHNITFSDNTEFRSAMNYALRQFYDGNFKKNVDLIGLAIGEVCNNKTVKTDIQDILAWSRTSSNEKAFFKKVGKFKAKSRILGVFETVLRKVARKKLASRFVWEFLKCFVVVPYDFEGNSARDTKICHDLLLNSLGRRNARNAQNLFSILYGMAAEFGPQGGEITRDTLAKKIEGIVSYAVPVLQGAGADIYGLLVRRMANKIAAEKNSKKYIPDVFVDVGIIKDEARLFCHPSLFLIKLVDDERNIEVQTLNRMLRKVGLPQITIALPDNIAHGQFGAVEADVRKIRLAVNKILDLLRGLSRAERSNIRHRVSISKRGIFDRLSWQFSDLASIVAESEVKPILHQLDIAEARVFAIVSRAGQGKTNFVCDLVEHCLAKRGIPCAFFTGKELQHIGRGQLGEYIAHSIYEDEHPGGIDTFLGELEAEARQRNVAGVIIIDALNEHNNLVEFSKEIEAFIEKCVSYQHIRVLFTCRSEYFDIRYSNLLESSFANKMIIEREIHENIGEEHRKRLVKGYLNFYRIRCPWMSEDVNKRLGEDPFLLRMFCEAYGNPSAEKDSVVPRIWHIRKEAIFRRYLDRKLRLLRDRSAARTKRPYEAILRKMIEWMLGAEQFSDVPISIFNENEISVLDELLGEDIILRRDLKEGKSVLDESYEVINFTFDEFRDYLLSDHLINVVLRNDENDFVTKMSKLTEVASTVAEGLSQYLFCASRYSSDPNAQKVIENQKWYGDIYISCIFDLDEQYVSQDDIGKVEALCLQGDIWAPEIIASLLVRYNSDNFTKLNIDLLFKIFDTMNDKLYEDITDRTFRTNRYGTKRAYYPIDKLTRKIKEIIIVRGRRWKPVYANLVELLLYLWDVLGDDDSCPAQRVFGEFAEVHPGLAKQLLSEHIRKNRKGCRGNVSMISGREVIDGEHRMYAKNKKQNLVLYNTNIGIIVCCPRLPSLRSCHKRAGTNEGTYASELVCRIHEHFIEGAMDLREEYNKYYRDEYRNLECYIYHKYGCATKYVNVFRQVIKHGKYIGIIKERWGKDWQIEQLSDTKKGNSIILQVLGAEWVKVEDEN